MTNDVQSYQPNNSYNLQTLHNDFDKKNQASYSAKTSLEKKLNFIVDTYLVSPGINQTVDKSTTYNKPLCMASTDYIKRHLILFKVLAVIKLLREQGIKAMNIKGSEDVYMGGKATTEVHKQCKSSPVKKGGWQVYTIPLKYS